ncbi:hypothetical protein EWI07_00730 [Sporolactobacillus sp. THM7-4]|nr:hypothetical protein EWI07_00730 [Sporolactobacillus sp. THM7-4]
MTGKKEYPIRLIFGGSNGAETLLNIVFERPDHSLKNIKIDPETDKLQLLSFEDDISEGKVIYEDKGLFGQYKLTKIILPKNISILN